MITSSEYIWDIASGDGVTVTDGSGTWIDGGTNWNNGVGNIAWTNAAVPGAIFGEGSSGTAGVVTVSGGITVGNITFNAPHAGNYTIAGNTITLSGSPQVSANVDAAINATLAGAGFTKAGSGTLALGGNNTYTGATTVSAGTLLVNGSLANGSMTIESGATCGGTGTLNCHLDDDPPDLITVEGTFDIDELTLAMHVTGVELAHEYVLVNYSTNGTIRGRAFAAVTGRPAGWMIDYDGTEAHPNAIVARYSAGSMLFIK